MRRRLIAAVAALVVIGSMIAIPTSSSAPCCCKTSCSMHQKHAAQGCRLDRCSGERDAATAGVAATRAVLVSIVLPPPVERAAVFARISAAPETRAVAPSIPPPRAA